MRRCGPLTAAWLAIAIAATGCNQILGIKDIGTGTGPGADANPNAIDGPPDGAIAEFVVTETTPAANATDGDVEAAPQIGFSHPVDPATITGSTITLVHRPDDAPVAITPSIAGGRVTLALAKPLDFLEPYRLTITSGVADASGTHLAADVVVDFTARDGHWTAPVAVAPAGAGKIVKGANIAAGPTRFWLGWTEEDSSEIDAYATNVSVTGVHDMAFQLATNETLAGFSIGIPEITVGPNDTAFVRYGYSSGGLASYIKARTWDPGTGWSTQLDWSSANQSAPPAPIVGIDHDGNIYTASVSFFDPPPPIGTRVRVGGTWAAPQSLGLNAGITGMWASTSVAGAALVYGDTTRMDVATYFKSDGTFHAGSATLYVAGSGSSIQCSMLDTGYYDSFAWAALVQNGTGNGVVGSGGSFTTGDFSVSCPVAAVDPKGNELVAWTSGSGAATNLHARRYVANVGMGTTDQVDDPAKGASSMPGVVLDGAGRGVAIWAQNDGVTNAIRARRYRPGAGWNATIDDVQLPGGQVNRLQLVGEPSGRALALIERSDGLWLALFH